MCPSPSPDSLKGTRRVLTASIKQASEIPYCCITIRRSCRAAMAASSTLEVADADELCRVLPADGRRS
eukprot:6172512-Pleurochrysis_carterae.AAC.2